MSEQKTTTIEVNEADVKLARRIMGEMGAKSLKELFHKWCEVYFVPTVEVDGGMNAEILEVES